MESETGTRTNMKFWFEIDTELLDREIYVLLEHVEIDKMRNSDSRNPSLAFCLSLLSTNPRLLMFLSNACDFSFVLRVVTILRFLYNFLKAT